MSEGHGPTARQDSVDTFLSASTAGYNRTFSRGISVVSEYESEYDYLDMPDDWDEDFIDERFEPGTPRIPFSDIQKSQCSLDDSARKYFIPGQKVKVVSITAVDTSRVISPYIYTIELRHADRVWSVRRRYKHFQELHKELLIERAKFSISTHLPTEEGRRRKSEGCPRRRLPRFPKTPDALVRDERIERRCEQLKRYLQNALRCRLYRNHESMLKFLEVSHLSFVHNLGQKLKEGIVKKRSGGRRINIGPCSCCPRVSTSHWSDRWLVVKDTFVAYVNPDDGRIGDVLLMDQDFKVGVGWEKTGIHHGLKISNLSRHLLIKSWTHRKSEEWQKCIEHTASTLGREFTTPNRFDSFAPERTDTLTQWFVDGCSYFDSVATALELAKEEVFITDWWLSPELYLKRPVVKGNKWRLDHILLRKANEGVKIFILLYKEIEMTLGINSYHSKMTLKHDNIKILRHPDHGAGGVLLWAHHEKIVCVDQRIAFLGGLDLCYGRWDDQVHRLTDLGAVDVAIQEQVLSPIAQMTMQIMDAVAFEHMAENPNAINPNDDTIMKSTKEIESILEMTKKIHLSIRDDSTVQGIHDMSLEDSVFVSPDKEDETENNNNMDAGHTVKIGNFEVTTVADAVTDAAVIQPAAEDIVSQPASAELPEEASASLTRTGSKKKYTGQDLVVKQDSLKVPPLARFFSDEYGDMISSESSEDENEVARQKLASSQLQHDLKQMVGNGTGRSGTNSDSVESQYVNNAKSSVASVNNKNGKDNSLNDFLENNSIPVTDIKLLPGKGHFRFDTDNSVSTGYDEVDSNLLAQAVNCVKSEPRFPGQLHSGPTQSVLNGKYSNQIDLTKTQHAGQLHVDCSAMSENQIDIYQTHASAVNTMSGLADNQPLLKSVSEFSRTGKVQNNFVTDELVEKEMKANFDIDCKSLEDDDADDDKILDDSGLSLDSSLQSPSLGAKLLEGVTKKFARPMQRKQSSKDSGQGQSFEEVEPLIQPSLTLDVSVKQDVSQKSWVENTPRKNVRFKLLKEDDTFDSSQTSSDSEADVPNLSLRKVSNENPARTPPRRKRLLKRQLRADGSPRYPTTAEQQKEQIAEMKNIVHRLVSVDSILDYQNTSANASMVDIMNANIEPIQECDELLERRKSETSATSQLDASPEVKMVTWQTDVTPISRNMDFDEVDSPNTGPTGSLSLKSPMVASTPQCSHAKDKYKDGPRMKLIDNVRDHGIERQHSSPGIGRPNKPPDLVLTSVADEESYLTWHAGSIPTTYLGNPSTPKFQRKKKKVPTATLR